ncbi:MAG: hydantoinase/oxoprolinase family protein [Acetobacterales bacterium]
MSRSAVDASARLAVDIGGTFTDVVVEGPKGRATTKVLTTHKAPERGVMDGIKTVLDEAGLRPGDISLIIHGTTLATNALIERKGARTALITTDGFRDSIEIGYEHRFEQYDLYVQKPPPLVPRHLRLGVPERMAADGSVLLPLNEKALGQLVPILKKHEIEAVAIGFLHSYANGAHERHVRDILQEKLPETYITLSSEVCPEVREYDRFSTACANAYIQPLMARYLTRLDKDLRKMGLSCPLYLMMSGGGLTTLETAIANPIRLVESGPAGGAILAAFIAGRMGTPDVLSFDMGGTTAKICLIDDYKPQQSRSFEVAREYRFLKGSGLPLLIPVIEMVEIGAGGGSIARVDDLNRIHVGPNSAGSEPGPASYDRGGEMPTVTDADVVMGRIDPNNFAGGKMTLSKPKALEALKKHVGDPLGMTANEAAFGVCEIVDENMANAARVHAVERGKVLNSRTLIAYGGAAPLHAARLAEKLDIDHIVIPNNAGVGSALGFLLAPVAYEVVRSRYMKLEAFDPEVVNGLFDEMKEEATEIVRRGAPKGKLAETRTAMMRYVGQGHEIVVEVPVRQLKAEDAAVLQKAFDAAYNALFDRTIPEGRAEILSWTLALSTEAETPEKLRPVQKRPAPRPSGRRDLLDPDTGEAVSVPVYDRRKVKIGTLIRGPAVIVESETSTFVSNKYDAHVNDRGYIVLERKPAKSRRRR